jgi:hypothetical protein
MENTTEIRVLVDRPAFTYRVRIVRGPDVLSVGYGARESIAYELSLQSLEGETLEAAKQAFTRQIGYFAL